MASFGDTTIRIVADTSQLQKTIEQLSTSISALDAAVYREYTIALDFIREDQARTDAYIAYREHYPAQKEG